MAVDIQLAGLEAPGCQAEVGGDGAGMPEARRVIDAGLVGQRGYEAHPGCTHQASADRVVVRHVAGAVVEFAKAAVQHQAGIQ